ncbi:MAG: hypothetical protein RSB63_09855 [Enterococcus sp.]|uniref:hypothetical protein n=1 Tax=Enterococcus sp. TaxID=35783 RepID=UPI002FCA7FF0
MPQMKQDKNRKLDNDEIIELDQNYIKSDSDSFLSRFQNVYKEFSNDSSNSNFEKQFESLYNFASNMNPAALPYADLTTLIFTQDDDGETTSVFIASLEEFYKTKFNDLKATSSLSLNDKKSIAVLAKAKEHINLALGQKRILLLEQKQEINKLNTELKEEQENLKRLTEDSNEASKTLEEYKKKYDKMTIDFLSMMGIFSTIIFAVFGGLSQIGAIGDNLPDTPIPKILMYISLSSITLILIVFISFSAISRLTGLPIRSCKCESDKVCNCQFYQRHPSLSFSLFFFIDLFLFSIILRLTKYSDWVPSITDLYHPIFKTESIIKLLAIIIFITLNIIGAKIIFLNRKKK